MAGRLLGRAAWWADDLHYSSRRAPRIAPSAACCVRAGERILHLGSLRRHQSTPACTLDSWPCARIARLPCRRDQNHLQPARIHPRCCLGRELSIHPGFDRRSSRRHSLCFKPPEVSRTLCVCGRWARTEIIAPTASMRHLRTTSPYVGRIENTEFRSASLRTLQRNVLVLNR